MADMLNYKKLSDVQELLGNSGRRLKPTTKPEQLVLPTYDGSGQAVHTNVICVREKFVGYKYWMAMTPYPGGIPDYEQISILASNDGFTWVVPTGLTNPIVSTFSPDPYLIYDVTTARLYVYYVKGDPVNLIRRKWSTDGITWSAEELTNIYFLAPSIVKLSANSWVLWGTSVHGIVRYTSTDGLNWVNGAECILNVIGSMWHNSVLADGIGYHFLSAIKEPNMDSSGTMLYYGYSKDGITIDYDTTPLIIPSESGWYSRQIYLSSLVAIEDNKYRVYLSAASTDGTWHGGYMDAKMSAWGRTELLSDTTKQIVLVDGATIAAGATLYGPEISLAGTPYVAYSLSANGSKSYSVWESFYVRLGSPLASKPGTSIGASAGFYNSTRLNVVAPKKKWGVKNDHATEAGIFTLTLTLYPR